MDQKRIANQILRYLDPGKRKTALRFLIFLMVVSLFGLLWANRWESPLAVMPRTFCAVLFGYLLLYIQSLRLYPVIECYFNKDALMRDAGEIPPPLPTEIQQGD